MVRLIIGISIEFYDAQIKLHLDAKTFFYAFKKIDHELVSLISLYIEVFCIV